MLAMLDRYRQVNVLSYFLNQLLDTMPREILFVSSVSVSIAFLVIVTDCLAQTRASQCVCKCLNSSLKKMLFDVLMSVACL